MSLSPALQSLVDAERTEMVTAADHVARNLEAVHALAPTAALAVDVAPSAVAAKVGASAWKIWFAVAVGSAIAAGSAAKNEVYESSRVTAPVVSTDPERPDSKPESKPGRDRVPVVPTELPKSPATNPSEKTDMLFHGDERTLITTPARPRGHRPAPVQKVSRARKREIERENALELELALIRKAQVAVRERRYAEALRVLSQHEVEFARGTMTEDREALRVISLCAAGRHTRGKVALEKFEKKWPLSLAIDRVREACED